jgi:hypothetical protein
MRELEMRQRIERLLRRPLHGMLAPALGLGLALGGCELGGSEYMAQFPRTDGGSHDTSGSTSDIPVYSAPIPLDGAVDSGQVDAPLATDAEKDAAGDAAISSEARPALDTSAVVDTESKLPG